MSSSSRLSLGRELGLERGDDRLSVVDRCLCVVELGDDRGELGRQDALLRIRLHDLRLQRRDACIDGCLLADGVLGSGRPGGDQRDSKPEQGEESPSHTSRFAHRGRTPFSHVALELLKRRGDVASERADLRTVVLVGDRAGPVVELELLERSERAVAGLEQLEPTLLGVVEVVERVGLGLRLAEERHRDRDDACDCERRSEHESKRQRVAGRPTAEARSTSRRCSRRSGHSVMTEPMRNTRPASQMRFTSGLTKTRK